MKFDKSKIDIKIDTKFDTQIIVTLMLALVVLELAILLTWAGLAGENTVPASADKKPPKETKLSIVCVGDVMSHEPQTRAQYDSVSNAYDYHNNFKYVKPYIEQADLALCNVETTFAGKPYTGFPNFSSPEALADALKDAGFDVGMTANNHMADKGLDGILKTRQVLEEKGLSVTGSVQEKGDAPFVIEDVKGIKVGIVAFTYETGSGQGAVSINGSVVSDEIASRINSFNFNTMEEDKAKIKSAMDKARKAGAQVLIVYYHWGEEYQREANKYQKELAQATADMGADIIFASHPHVLQETEYLTANPSKGTVSAGEAPAQKAENTDSDGKRTEGSSKKEASRETDPEKSKSKAASGKKVPVFYSMGNFISNQRTETLGNRATEQGLIARVDLTYSEDGGVKEAALSGTPTWVDRYYSGGKTVYEIVPLDDNLKENEAIAVSGHLSRAQQAKEDANETLGFNH